ELKRLGIKEQVLTIKPVRKVEVVTITDASKGQTLKQQEFLKSLDVRTTPTVTGRADIRFKQFRTGAKEPVSSTAFKKPTSRKVDTIVLGSESPVIISTRKTSFDSIQARQQALARKDPGLLIQQLSSLQQTVPKPVTKFKSPSFQIDKRIARNREEFNLPVFDSASSQRLGQDTFSTLGRSLSGRTRERFVEPPVETLRGGFRSVEDQRRAFSRLRASSERSRLVREDLDSDRLAILRGEEVRGLTIA
ncbi:unnamed protein product, partial [marine sediment metagenome]